MPMSALDPDAVYVSADADDATDPLAIPKVAWVAPKTVSKAAEHLEAWERARLAHAVSQGRRNGPVTTVRLHPDAWRAAMALADGDARRIEIHTPDSFTVHNERIK